MYLLQLGRKKIAFKSIRSKLIVVFFLLIILPLSASSILSYNILTDISREKAFTNNGILLSNARVNIERIFNDMKTAADSIIYDRAIIDIMSKKTQDDVDEYFDLADINSRFFTIKTTSLDIYEGSIIAVILDDGRFYSSPNFSIQDLPITDILQKEEFLELKKYRKWASAAYMMKPSVTSSVRPYFAYLLKFSDYRLKTEIGNIIISIPVNELKKILQTLLITSETEACIISDTGLAIASSDDKANGKQYVYYNELTQGVPSKVIEINTPEGKGILNFQNIGATGWRIVQTMPEGSVLSELVIMRNRMILIDSAFFLVFLFIAVLVARSISNPINSISEASRQIALGKLYIRIRTESRDEVGRLAESFNHMADEVKYLMDTVSRDADEKRELELQMLYAQINPHFLFNTLNSIRWMADAVNAHNISRLVVSLANLLKSSIIKEGELIPLAEEVENVKNYVFIQKIRYGVSFDVEYHVDKDVENEPTLKLILQPIVENSIIHGFQGIDYKGIIDVCCIKDGMDVLITISDNGIGMDEKVMNIILDSDVKNRSQYSSIGIHHVNRRLELHFGPRYGLLIERLPERGIKISLRFPASEKGDEIDV